MQKRGVLILFLTFGFLFVFLFFYTLSSHAKKFPIENNNTKNQLTNTITKAPTPTITPFLTPTPTPTIISSPTPSPIIVLEKDLDNLFTKFSNEYGVDKNLLKKIANCESGLNLNADSGNYKGLFQFSEQTWINARNLMGVDPEKGLCFNAEESIRTAAFLISQGRVNIWPTCSK